MKWIKPQALDFFFSYGNADLSKYAKDISERFVPSCFVLKLYEC